jgi:hypothetical protein
MSFTCNCPRFDCPNSICSTVKLWSFTSHAFLHYAATYFLCFRPNILLADQSPDICWKKARQIHANSSLSSERSDLQTPDSLHSVSKTISSHAECLAQSSRRKDTDDSVHIFSGSSNKDSSLHLVENVYKITMYFPDITANIVRCSYPLNFRVLSTISGHNYLFQNHCTPREVGSFIATADIPRATFKAKEVGIES